MILSLVSASASIHAKEQQMEGGIFIVIHNMEFTRIFLKFLYVL